MYVSQFNSERLTGPATSAGITVTTIVTKAMEFFCKPM